MSTGKVGHKIKQSPIFWWSLILLLNLLPSLSHGFSEAAVKWTLSASPREVDLGMIYPGGQSKGQFAVIGKAAESWTAVAPPGWVFVEGREISGHFFKEPVIINISLGILPMDEKPDMRVTGNKTENPVRMTVEIGGESVTYEKMLPFGRIRESLKITAGGTYRTLFLKFQIAPVSAAPVLAVEPLGIDLGLVEPGKSAARKVAVLNRGSGTLNWRAGLKEIGDNAYSGQRPKSHYVSFINEEARNKNTYSLPAHMTDQANISGSWTEEGSFLVGRGHDAIMKYAFFGTGCVLFLQKGLDEGRLQAYIDDRFLKIIDCRASQMERAEVKLIDDLTEGNHVLTLMVAEGHARIEGMRIYDSQVKNDPKGWIRIFPDSGVSAHEAGVVNLKFNFSGLTPGYYSEMICFESNGGATTVEVSFLIAKETSSRLIDIYRYERGVDHLYTGKPEAEDAGVIRTFKSQGIVFRLFPAGTPGTKEFFRWYSPASQNHFYSYEQHAGGKSLQGYQFEGSIGNIAILRLTGTRELYRWYHPLKGLHFYTVDPGGEGYKSKGYRFDGIAGFVK
jgi:hypothetical protein